MSKQITSAELAAIVTKLLTDPEGAGELSGHESYQAFMTDIAQVVCNHCGGEIHHSASDLDDIWYIGIHGNDSLPDAFGGIWREYDKDGRLFPEGELSLADFQKADAALLKTLGELPESNRRELVDEIVRRGYEGTDQTIIADVLADRFGSAFKGTFYEGDFNTAQSILCLEELADQQIRTASIPG